MNETQTQTPAVDPFDMPSGATDISYPILKPDKNYRMRIKSVELNDTKSEDAPPDAKTMCLTYATTKTELDTNDNEILEGFTLKQHIGITAYGKRTKPNIKRDLDTILQGALGKGNKVTTNEFLKNPDVVKDKIVDIRVGFRKAQGSFPESNTARVVVAD
jgi:hypothetical protein